jgi:hypothetical protein
LCERLKVQPAELGYIEREQSAGVVEEHAKPPDPAAPKPTPTPIPLPQPFDLLDPDKGSRPLSAKAKQSEAKRSEAFCPMTRSLHPPITARGHRVRFARTWREGFFEVPFCLLVFW